MPKANSPERVLEILPPHIEFSVMKRKGSDSTAPIAAVFCRVAQAPKAQINGGRQRDNRQQRNELEGDLEGNGQRDKGH